MKKSLLMLSLSAAFLFSAAACGGPEPVQPSLNGGSSPSPSALSESQPIVSFTPEEPSAPVDITDDSARASEGGFLSLSDSALMAFMLDEADGSDNQSALGELGARFLARPGEVLDAMAEYDGYAIARWPDSGDGAHWLAEQLALEFAVTRNGADDAAFRAALDGQSGGMAQLLRDAFLAVAPTEIAHRIYNALTGAEEITVTLVADEGGGTWTGSPAELDLPWFVGDWDWSEAPDSDTGGAEITPVEWTLTLSAGETSIQFFSGDCAAACTCDGVLSVLRAEPLCLDNLNELLYQTVITLPLQ